MKKIVAIVLVASTLILAGNKLQAQNKFGYISLSELITAMPEYKKADSSMQEYQGALNQNFEDMKREFSEKDSLLSSKDTTKYTRAQIEIKRKTCRSRPSSNRFESKASSPSAAPRAKNVRNSLKLRATIFFLLLPKQF